MNCIERPRAEGFANHLSISCLILSFNTTTGIFWESLNHLHFSIPKSVLKWPPFLSWPISAEASLARAHHLPLLSFLGSQELLSST